MPEEKALSKPIPFHTYLINLALLLLLGYLIFLLYQKHSFKPFKSQKPVALAHIRDYGMQAYIGPDLKHLIPYDVKVPLAEGVFVLVEKGGHMIFNTNANVEISLQDEVLICIKKNGIDILEGEIIVNHPSGKLPVDFNIYHKGELLTPTVLPRTFR